MTPEAASPIAPTTPSGSAPTATPTVPSEPTPTAPAQRTRFASVDTFRGALLVGMIFTPSTAVGEHFAFLRHAEWDGVTLNDWIFPAFLVTSGLSLSFLLRNRSNAATYRRLIRRLLLLVFLGIAYNAYGTSWFDISELRLTGVLQMIGIAGACGALVVLASRAIFGEDKMWLIIAAAATVILLYGLGLDLLSCDPVDRCSPYFDFDSAVLGTSHVYRAGNAGWDPEGLVLSMASSSFVLFGYSAGMLIRRHGRDDPQRTLASVGTLAALCVIVGLAASLWSPPNKRLLTPSFALLVAGTALAVVCVIYLLVDAGSGSSGRESIDRLRRAATWPIIAFGRNAIIVYLFERVLLHAARSVHIGDRSIETRLMEDILPIGAPGVHIAYAAVLGLVIYLLVGTMHRRRAYLAL